MPAAIWATPMARVRLGRLERPCMRSRQGLGPCFQALASATGWMRAMTPSPMRTMAAKCFARVGVVMSIWGRSGARWGRLPGEDKGPGLKPFFSVRVFQGLKPPAHPVEQATARQVQRQRQDNGRSRFPEGMTERKASARATANAGVLRLRLRMTAKNGQQL